LALTLLLCSAAMPAHALWNPLAPPKGLEAETDKGIIGWVKNSELNDSILPSGELAEFSGSAREQFDTRKIDSVLTVGGGFFIYASRNFLLRAEYNSHTVLTSREQNDEVHEWKAGFSVFF